MSITIREIYGINLGLIICFLGLIKCSYSRISDSMSDNFNSLSLNKTVDFEINGYGNSNNWERASWVDIPQRYPGRFKRKTRFKTLYSDQGIYFFFECFDSLLTNTFKSDFQYLWKEDVVEVFLWTSEKKPSYFEYEISPLNFELPILVSNFNGDIVRWIPFYYENDRKIQHKTSIIFSKEGDSSLVQEWKAELFIPYKWLRPLSNIPPRRGTMWKGNFYRIDYDNGKATWAWKPTQSSFHEFRRFGRILFK